MMMAPIKKNQNPKMLTEIEFQRKFVRSSKGLVAHLTEFPAVRHQRGIPDTYALFDPAIGLQPTWFELKLAEPVSVKFNPTGKNRIDHPRSEQDKWMKRQSLNAPGSAFYLVLVADRSIELVAPGSLDFKSRTYDPMDTHWRFGWHPTMNFPFSSLRLCLIENWRQT